VTGDQQGSAIANQQVSSETKPNSLAENRSRFAPQKPAFRLKRAGDTLAANFVL